MNDKDDVEYVTASARKLLAYCQQNDWAGYDPYDALNSRLLGSLPLLDSRLPRLVFTQALKRSPLNPRGLLLIPKMQNPKGIALFLSALLRSPRLATDQGEDLAILLTRRLMMLRSPGIRQWCWGYSFPWQTRSMLVPRWTPNLICTQFAASALLDLFEQRRESQFLEMARSAAEYMLSELYWSEDEASAGFSYPLPSMRNQVHNANLLAAALLCRVYRLTGEERFLEPALKVARYSAHKQQSDGSWAYGEGRSQQWVDNFHTGYNLCALQAICRDVGTVEFESNIRRGYEFYRTRFFRQDGAVRYFHNQTYPLDIHCVAQSIITLLAFRDIDPDKGRLAWSVFRWAMNNMWDDRGFFYYRALRFGTIRISYMRWSQAWMLRALSELIYVLAVSAEPAGLPGTRRVVTVC